MPVRKVKGGWKWGKNGKVYKRKADAERQGRAIKLATIIAASGGKKKYKRKKK